MLANYKICPLSSLLIPPITVYITMYMQILPSQTNTGNSGINHIFAPSLTKIPRRKILKDPLKQDELVQPLAERTGRVLLDKLDR